MSHVSRTISLFMFVRRGASGSYGRRRRRRRSDLLVAMMRWPCVVLKVARACGGDVRYAQICGTCLCTRHPVQRDDDEDNDDDDEDDTVVPSWKVLVGCCVLYHVCRVLMVSDAPVQLRKFTRPAHSHVEASMLSCRPSGFYHVLIHNRMKYL